MRHYWSLGGRGAVLPGVAAAPLCSALVWLAARGRAATGPSLTRGAALADRRADRRGLARSGRSGRRTTRPITAYFSPSPAPGSWASAPPAPAAAALVAFRRPCGTRPRLRRDWPRSAAALVLLRPRPPSPGGGRLLPGAGHRRSGGGRRGARAPGGAPGPLDPPARGRSATGPTRSYLWHWPVIVLVRSYLGPERFASIPVRAACTLAVVVLLSWATYRWVETPFRTGRTWRRAVPCAADLSRQRRVVLATASRARRSCATSWASSRDEPAISTADYDGQEARQRPLRRAGAGLRARGRGGAGRPGRPHPGPPRPSRRRPPRWATATTGRAPPSCARSGDSGRRSQHRRARRLPRAGALAGDREDRRGARLPRLRARLQRLHRHRAVQIDRDTGRAWEDCEDVQGLGRRHDLGAEPGPGRGVHRGRASSSTRRPGDVAAPAQDPAIPRRCSEAGWQTLFEDLDDQARARSTSSATPPSSPGDGRLPQLGTPDLGDCAFQPGPASTSGGPEGRSRRPRRRAWAWSTR